MNIFKKGDKVKIIKRLPDNTTGMVDYRLPNGDVGKIGKIINVFEERGNYTVWNNDYLGIFKSEELELVTELGVDLGYGEISTLSSQQKSEDEGQVRNMTIKLGEKYKIKPESLSKCGFKDDYENDNGCYVVFDSASGYGIFNSVDEQVSHCGCYGVNDLMPMSDTMATITKLNKEQEAGLSKENQALLQLELISDNLIPTARGHEYNRDFMFAQNREALAKKAQAEIDAIEAEEAKTKKAATK